MPKFFFEAGTFQDLSYAELSAVSNTYGLNTDCIKRFSEKIFLIESKDFSSDKGLSIFNRLGGFIRFGEIVDSETFLDKYNHSDRKVIFGTSVLDNDQYFDNDFVRKLSRALKGGLKEYGVSSRFIDAKDRYPSLNSAQVLKNDILTKGFELCLIDNGNEKIYGSTLAIQDVDGFVKRDYEKPYTDTDMGTLPPKLARMLVNLTGLRSGIIWDPFCGSGTILLEAAVLGFDVFGSDVSNNAVHYTTENILWLEDQGLIGEIKYNVLRLDIKDVEKKTVLDLKRTDIGAVVCEPYMGPPQKRVMSPLRADELIKDVKDLYSGLFKVLEKVLKPGHVAVIITPSYKTHSGWKTFSIHDIIDKRWNILNSSLAAGRDLKWSRKNSIITRNIFVLQKR
mgnify:FL=1